MALIGYQARGMSAELLEATSLALVVAVPTLYSFRTSDQRPLRGRWLVGIGALVACVATIAWHQAASVGMDPSALHLAFAATVPLAQLILLVLSLAISRWLVGRPPARFTFNGREQMNSDAAMHAFVLFVIEIGGIAMYATFRH
jgi:hypothetical protein